jgi:hypothetical protein
VVGSEKIVAGQRLGRICSLSTVNHGLKKRTPEPTFLLILFRNRCKDLPPKTSLGLSSQSEFCE